MAVLCPVVGAAADLLLLGIAKLGQKWREMAPNFPDFSINYR